MSMKLGRKTLLVLSILAGLAAGVFPAWGQWVSVDRRWISGDKFEVDIPEGWLLRTPVEDQMILTRDGAWLQTVRIERVSVEKELPNIKKPFAKGMLPEQIRELIADDLRSNQAKLNFRILEATTAEVGGYSGFKLLYSYETSRRLKMSGVHYGALVDTWYYFLSYEAVTRYYFARDQRTFERLKDSFKITL